MGDKINDKEIVEISINKLENHPMNESIYSSRREQDDLELEQSISELGLLEPLTIIPKNNYKKKNLKNDDKIEIVHL